MKAIVVSQFGQESVLRIQDVPLPEPGPGEVRVRIRAAGVNPVETYIRSGKYGSLPSLPYTPGTDGAGEIDALGPGVEHLSAGDRVFVAAVLALRNTGTYAEYAVCDAAAVKTLPEPVGFSQGAGLGTPGQAACTALYSKARIRPGERVLIHGATGGVGSLALQLARRGGAVTVGTAGDREGLDLLRELGAHHVFNHKEDGYEQRIREAFGGGSDVIVEMLANVNLGRDLDLVAPHGRIVIVGSKGTVELSPRDAMRQDAVIYGMLLSNMTPCTFRENMYWLGAALEDALRVVVGRELPLDRAAEAHALVAGGSLHGKVVLTM